jgi:bacterial microcompartment shell protein
MSLALGMLETRGLVACLEAADAMLKSARVSVVGLQKIGGGLVTVMVRGDVGAVRSAVDAGSEAAGKLGQVNAVHIIPGPHEELEEILTALKSGGMSGPGAGRSSKK